MENSNTNSKKENCPLNQSVINLQSLNSQVSMKNSIDDYKNLQCSYSDILLPSLKSNNTPLKLQNRMESQEQSVLNECRNLKDSVVTKLFKGVSLEQKDILGNTDPFNYKGNSVIEENQLIQLKQQKDEEKQKKKKFMLKDIASCESREESENSEQFQNVFYEKKTKKQFMEDQFYKQKQVSGQQNKQKHQFPNLGIKQEEGHIDQRGDQEKKEGGKNQDDCQNSEELQEQRKQDDQNKEKVQEIICNCKKSKCLKLYCECFENNKMCNNLCNCTDCRNCEKYLEERNEAVEQLLTRNPEAFQSKVEVLGDLLEAEKEKEKNNLLGLKKGCNCKKTFCRKKYCECYNEGLKCSYLCQCENCMNGKNNEELNNLIQSNDQERKTSFSFGEKDSDEKLEVIKKQIKLNNQSQRKCSQRLASKNTKNQ